MDPSGQTRPDPRVQALLANSVRMMEELGELTRRLATLGSTPAANGSDQVGALEDELRAFQERFASFADDGRKVAAQLDSSIRKNPYLYLLGMLGLGFLLGKARRL